LKNSLVQLIITNRASHKIINTQLCVALANLALQFLSWKGVIPELVNSLGSNPETISSLLEFLKVLPEELSSSRKLPISDEEYRVRTIELLSENAEHVFELLLNLINTPQFPTYKSLIFQCFNSWLREIDSVKVVNSPLLNLIFQALFDIDTFESAVECICSMIRETRDVDESMPVIQALYPLVISLRPKITECKDDPDAYSGYTRLFAEAGESWHMLIARAPKDFRGLVEAIAECTAFDEDLDVVQYTFHFWYLLKQMIVMDRYNEARNELGDIYLTLVHVIIDHLQYPAGDGADLFDGDREEEDKFKDFRHEMGDVLKDCCSVIGASRALGSALTKVIEKLNALNNGAQVPWQQIEAPLFSMRAMAREVDIYEDEILPQFMKILEKLPEHEKIRYATTLVLGRYTEWTAKHPEYLELQLNYITNGFTNPSKAVISAAAQALKHFCQDCSQHLTNFVDQLYPFYENVAGTLDLRSYYEVTDGIAHVVRAQPLDVMLQALQYFGNPICTRLLEKAQLPGNDQLHRDIADEIELLNIFVETVDVEAPIGTKNPTAQFVIEVLPVISQLLDKHGFSSYVAERGAKFIRFSLFSCGSDLLDVLPTIAELLASQFQKTHFGCYLYVTGTVFREFSREDTSENIKASVWAFGQEQITTFFKYLATINPANAPDLIEDFFRLMGDVVMYFPFQLIASDLFLPSFDAALIAINLNEYDTIITGIQYLQDLFAYGSKYPPSSVHKSIPDNIRSIIVRLANEKGQQLATQLILGLIFSLPKDTRSDALSLFLEVTQLVDQNTAITWITNTLQQLPVGTVTDEEKAKLVSKMSTALNSGDYKRIKSQISDFTVWYSRRNVTPRSGIATPRETQSSHGFSFNG